MQYIRQNATHKVVIGPVVAVGDGFTPVTTLSLATADEAEVILHDNGTVVDISGYTMAAITTADGYYHLTLQSGISGTVGHMTVVINDDSLCLPVKAQFTVVEEAVYDAFFASGATGVPALGALEASIATAQADLDILTGTDGVTLATAQGNYAPAKAGDNMGTVSAVTGGINTGAGTITTLDGLDTAQDTQHSTTQGKVDTAQADLDILTGTDGVTLATTQGNYAPATAAALATVDTVVDGIQADLDNGTDGLGALKTLIDAVQATADAVETDTQDIQSRLPAALVNSRMDSTIDGTGMESGAISAIFTTALTEAYRGTGATGTAAQLLYEILQNLTEFANSGTTRTVKKLDGSTTAKTYTYDDATNPTSITEAT